MALHFHILVVLLFKDIQQLVGVHLKVLDIPSPTASGQSIELTCSYELDGDKLYSVKWYKNNTEFYRYLPNDWPPGQFLPLPGVRVDLSKSGENKVYLNRISLESAGIYRCEVSAEAPSFQTVEASKQLEVTVFPTEGPRINGGRHEYAVGDTVNINCTSAKSRPEAQIRWYINNKPVQAEYITTFPTKHHGDGLKTSTVGLRFDVRDDHLWNGRVKLRCTATVSRAVELSNEAVIFTRQRHASDLRISNTINQVGGKATAKTIPVQLNMSVCIEFLMLLYYHSALFTHMTPV
ncbi:cell adhesion molecule 2-like [Tachypleus tridentatus]|uniref:cell adhesion molecule 2-like n=1 Tax=Tachypleus tridentatus TaxID=6853 RepID=UPI003FD1BA8E